MIEDKESLPPYVYHPLTGEEIRLVCLRPSKDPSAPIKILIGRTDLPESGCKLPRRMTRDELQKTVPPICTVHETRDGRYIFETEESMDWSFESMSFKFEHKFSWEHPDPDFKRSKYEVPDDRAIWDTHDMPFEALSYEWGPQDDLQTLIVDQPGPDDVDEDTDDEDADDKVGDDEDDDDADDTTKENLSDKANDSDDDRELPGPSALYVGKNLISALRHLRFPHLARWFWIDAICLNQQDDAEKAVQLDRMAQIYSRAYRVTAWLGPASDDSDKAMEALIFLGNQVCYTRGGDATQCPDAVVPRRAQRWGYIGRYMGPMFDKSVREAVKSLLARPWFERLWIVQELCLANKLTAILRCGEEEISVMRALSAVEWLAEDGVRWGDNRLSASLVKIQSIILTSPGFTSVDRLLGMHGGRECSRPHDVVYSLLGLFPKGIAATIKPDYSESVVETYKSVFLGSMDLTRRWGLFAFPGFKLDEGPSWVPDLLQGAWCSHSKNFQLSAGFSPVHYQYSETSKDQLRITGIRCAKVKEVRDAVLTRDMDSAYEIVQSWMPSNVRGDAYAGGGNLLEAYAHTLVQSRVHERHTEPEGSRFMSIEHWKLFVRENLWPSKRFVERRASRDDSENRNQKGVPLSIPVMKQLMQQYCTGCAFMKTEEGHIGLVPPQTKPGDIVCVILGSDHPLIFRPTETEGIFRFVGDAFVYGLQDGIPLLGKLPEPWTFRCRASGGDSEGNTPLMPELYNPETKETIGEDPRLGPLEDGWERVQVEDLGRDLTGDDPEVYSFFKNRTTGDLVNWDPRYSPDALKDLGVHLETFTLV